jgi:uncharacterized protein with FMN-binding domain
MNKSSITKYIVGGIIVVAFVIYVIFANKSSSPASTVTTTTTTDNTTNTAVNGEPITPNTTGTAATATAGAGQYKDGTYTGSVADAFYGKLQVSATISGGILTDVQFLQAPSGGESSEVSSRAEPALKQEAIAAQSAQVATVSGATQDTEAFNTSLAVALAQAKN